MNDVTKEKKYFILCRIKEKNIEFDMSPANYRLFDFNGLQTSMYFNNIEKPIKDYKILAFKGLKEVCDFIKNTHNESNIQFKKIGKQNFLLATPFYNQKNAFIQQGKLRVTIPIKVNDDAMETNYGESPHVYERYFVKNESIYDIFISKYYHKKQEDKKEYVRQSIGVGVKHDYLKNICDCNDNPYDYVYRGKMLDIKKAKDIIDLRFTPIETINIKESDIKELVLNDKTKYISFINTKISDKCIKYIFNNKKIKSITFDNYDNIEIKDVVNSKTTCKEVFFTNIKRVNIKNCDIKIGVSCEMYDCEKIDIKNSTFEFIKEPQKYDYSFNIHGFTKIPKIAHTSDFKLIDVVSIKLPSEIKEFPKQLYIKPKIQDWLYDEENRLFDFYPSTYEKKYIDVKEGSEITLDLSNTTEIGIKRIIESLKKEENRIRVGTLNIKPIMPPNITLEYNDRKELETKFM